MLHIDFRFIYLIGSLAIFLLFLLILYIRKDLRKISLLTGLILILSGPISEILFFRDYWYPPTFLETHILGIRIIPEDLIFAFAAPVFGALLYLIIFNKRFDKDFKPSLHYISNFCLLAIPLFGFFIGLTLIFKVNSIFSISISAILLSTFIILKKPYLLKPYLITSLLAFISAFLFYLIYIFIIGNGYLQSVWLLNHKLFGFSFLGTILPITEGIFAASVIPCIFLMIMFSSNLRIKSGK